MADLNPYESPREISTPSTGRKYWRVLGVLCSILFALNIIELSVVPRFAQAPAPLVFFAASTLVVTAIVFAVTAVFAFQQKD